ncbi:MAG TPA: non-homologous end-joining DNA ligase [Actinomycetota bacterium]|nr:non-homologous end-joining DNA ligase [Actinomycetota bacterium]
MSDRVAETIPTTVDFPIPLPGQRQGDGWTVRAGDIRLRLTNPGKVFWPETGYTKGDLLTYYFNVGTTIVPHLRDRPLTMKRQPDGVAGVYFYEKDAPGYTPRWMPTLAVRAETEDRIINTLSVCDVASLLFVVNLGCIELHPWLARGPRQARPTYAVFDLDPFPPAGWSEVRHVAKLVKLVLDRLDLPSYPKTSGGSGAQLFIPLDENYGFGEVRRVVQAICRLVHEADPETTTLEWEVSRRAGKVFLDANMNRRAASFASVYSVRAGWEAPVSVPFAWEEIGNIDPGAFTLATALRRIEAYGDLFAPTLKDGASLARAVDMLDLAGSDAGSSDGR